MTPLLQWAAAGALGVILILGCMVIAAVRACRLHEQGCSGSEDNEKRHGGRDI